LRSHLGQRRHQLLSDFVRFTRKNGGQLQDVRQVAEKRSTRLTSGSTSNPENDQNRDEFGTARLSDYFACGHTSLSVEFVASCAAAMQFLSEAGRCGEPAC